VHVKGHHFRRFICFSDVYYLLLATRGQELRKTETRLITYWFAAWIHGCEMAKIAEFAEWNAEFSIIPDL
jgi:hypothetical protein